LELKKFPIPKIETVTYRLVQAIRTKILQPLLLPRVTHPEVIRPHLDLRLVQASLLDDRLDILVGEHEALRRPGEHGALEARDVGWKEAWHVVGKDAGGFQPLLIS
jgi:hypothetical protein